MPLTLSEFTFEESQEETQILYNLVWESHMPFYQILPPLLGVIMVCPHIGNHRIALYLERGVLFSDCWSMLRVRSRRQLGIMNTWTVVARCHSKCYRLGE